MDKRVMADIAIVLGVVDAVLPAIEQELGRQWDKGNYINGPEFAGALERLRALRPSITGEE